MSVLTGAGDIKSNADAARAIHVAVALIVGSTFGQILVSGPLFAATVVIFLLALILVIVLEKKRSPGVVVPLFLITAISGLVQLAMMYHAGHPSLARISVVVGCLFASLRLFQVRRYQRVYVNNRSG